ncbi:MAG TPA: selenocysteine-specific translation elongation factor [bacterium (Candidatus Stahlbacteria)]|nr:selenocysteine-specific translation elongation factor [Candidatus Stahlbacteria bacterium]
MHRHVVIGTAGHIDHGKTALLKNIATGGTVTADMNADRLKEEQERGMTTDLGFVFFGDNVTIIDVPGHERFVHNMLAGAATIDLVILVIAADDGVMPQTIEHFEITRLLGISNGIIAVTKIDLVEPEMVEMVIDDIRKFLKGTYLEGAPIVPVSSITGEGIDRFKEELNRLVQKMERRPDRGIFRLWIDRCFVMKGFGLVVAGTVLSGRARTGERLEVLPIGKGVRVRGLQVHNKPVAEVKTGERAAFNLQGLEWKEVERGYVLAQPGYFKPTRLITAKLKVLESVPRPIRHRHTLIFHIGSAEAMVRLVCLEKNTIGPGEEAFVQLILDRPIACDWGDRFVLRIASPLSTVGGGVVIETESGLLKRKDPEVVSGLERLAEGSIERRLEEELLRFRDRPVKLPGLTRRLRVEEKVLSGAIKKLVEMERVVELQGRFFHQSHFNSLRTMILSHIEDFHKEYPVRKGIGLKEVTTQFSDYDAELIKAVIEEIVRSGEAIISENLIARKGFKPELTAANLKLLQRIEEDFLANLFQWKSREDLKKEYGEPGEVIIRILLDEHKLLDIGGKILHSNAINRAKEIVTRIFKEKGEIRVSDFRQGIRTTRKYALPILQYLDHLGVTVKVGEARRLKRK